MTERQLAEIEARWAKATPGPWQYENRENDDGMTDCHCITNGVMDYTFGYDMEEYDAIAIASAPTDIQALLAEVRRLNRMVDMAVEKLEARGTCPIPNIEYADECDNCREVAKDCWRKCLESEVANNG